MRNLHRQAVKRACAAATVHGVPLCQIELGENTLSAEEGSPALAQNGVEADNTCFREAPSNSNAAGIIVLRSFLASKRPVRMVRRVGWVPHQPTSSPVAWPVAVSTV